MYYLGCDINLNLILQRSVKYLIRCKSLTPYSAEGLRGHRTCTNVLSPSGITP